MSTRKIKVRIPATTANFGSGFDVIGAALKLYNEIEVVEVQRPRYGRSASKFRVQKSGLKISIEGEGKNVLPKDENNIVYQAMKKVFEICNKPLADYYLRLTNNIPLARGLGSSAAARIGGLVAANALSGNKLSQDKILAIAAKLEGHPDNVVPALLGGLCISYLQTLNSKHETLNKIGYIKLKIPEDLEAVLCIPEILLSTDKARQILPNKVPLQNAVFNCSRIALFITAITQKKYDLLSLALEDKLHQPYRKKFLPCMDDIFTAAKSAEGLGVCLSGSGTTTLVLSNKQSGKSGRIGQAMKKAFLRHKIKSKYIIVDFDNSGVKVIS